jgi:two-component sensor histidine kinase
MSQSQDLLDQPLPEDIAAGEAAFIRFYQKYAVFSWPWAWRRTLLFGSIGALAGTTFGISHGLFVRSWIDGIAVSLAFTAANILLVGTGPMLAAIFRHRDWPRRLQSTLVIASVVCGVFAGALSDDWASHFHDQRMAAHGARSTPKHQPTTDTHMLVRRVLDVSRDLLILFIASGGLALPAYFTEKQRWAEHWRRIELEKIGARKTESDLRLALLQAQVEPHFLFNTLASVRSLLGADPARAAQTIDALASYLRATLPRLRASTGTPLSLLSDQFALCASYLELMQLRLGERLQVESRLPADLRQTLFPPLLLISLVENAIKHGAEPKRGVTHIWLAARALPDAAPPRLEVTIEDDGAGLAQGTGEGTGLANVREQLLTRYKADASFELSQRAGGGVIARLVVPLENSTP